jgi:hypothetical protein
MCEPALIKHERILVRIEAKTTSCPWRVGRRRRRLPFASAPLRPGWSGGCSVRTERADEDVGGGHQLAIDVEDAARCGGVHRLDACAGSGPGDAQHGGSRPAADPYVEVIDAWLLVDGACPRVVMNCGSAGSRRQGRGQPCINVVIAGGPVRTRRRWASPALSGTFLVYGCHVSDGCGICDAGILYLAPWPRRGSAPHGHQEGQAVSLARM